MSVKTISVDSSVFSQLKYCPATRNLCVVFNSGQRYIYFDVPAQDVVNLSILTGTYFNTHIKGRYDFTQVL